MPSARGSARSASKGEPGTDRTAEPFPSVPVVPAPVPPASPSSLPSPEAPCQTSPRPRWCSSVQLFREDRPARGGINPPQPVQLSTLENTRQSRWTLARNGLQSPINPPACGKMEAEDMKRPSSLSRGSSQMREESRKRPRNGLNQFFLKPCRSPPTVRGLAAYLRTSLSRNASSRPNLAA